MNHTNIYRCSKCETMHRKSADSKSMLESLGTWNSFRDCFKRSFSLSLRRGTCGRSSKKQSFILKCTSLCSSCRMEVKHSSKMSALKPVFICAHPHTRLRLCRRMNFWLSRSCQAWCQKAHIDIYTSMYIAYIYIYIYAYTCIYIYICICTYIYIYIYI